jgi:chaperonin cofactor prefoldin
MAQIDTKITVKERQVQYYKKFKNLSVNEEILPQGDGNIRISPFDDYFLFTLYDETDGENTPIDLSNVGTIFISFIGNNDEIKIPNYTNVEDIDMSSGQVLFRISKENGKKILSLDNKNFYISTAMVSQDGTESDESVVYTGTFSKLTDEAKKSLTSQMDAIAEEYSIELSKLQQQNADLQTQVDSLNQTVNEQSVVIDSLNASNEELTNEITELTKNAESSKLIKLQKTAKGIQAQAQQAKENAAQVIGRQGKLSGTSKVKPNYESLAKVNQKYSI